MPSSSAAGKPVATGAHLAWRNLKVTIRGPTGGEDGGTTLLEGLTGYAEPGSITAIMGPSGSGKSTLLDTLAGRLSKSVRRTGDIFLNGHRQQLSYGVAAYVTQDDNLLGTLTVQETVTFSAFFRLADSLPRAEKMEIVHSTIREMGLRDAAHTTVGNWHLKGLSGGERRRLSIAVELLTKPRLLFLDEPTSGLDSAAAFYVMTTLKNLAEDGRTIISSIHQPSSEVYELFDNLILLSGGRTIYFGSPTEAHQHFVNAGMPCPPWRNPADHFLRAINIDFDRVPAHARKVEEDDVEEADTHLSMTTPDRVKHLVHLYQTSEFAIMADVKAQEISQMEGPLLESSGSEASTLSQAFTLTGRSFINMWRDLGYYWLRFLLYIILCISVGSVFFQLGTTYSAIQARASCMVFIVSFLAFMAVGGFPSFIEEMKVFSRERLNGHYGVGAFLISNTLASLPFLVIISFVSGALLYFLTGLHHGFSHYLYFVLVILTTVCVVESMMMAIATLVPNFLMGIIIAAAIQSVFIMDGGFFRLYDDLPKPVWKYPVYYMSFHSYAYQGLFQNDFVGLTFSSLEQGVVITGEEILREGFKMHSRRSKWVNLAILLVQAVAYRILFFLLIKLREKLGPGVEGLQRRYCGPAASEVAKLSTQQAKKS